MLRSTEGTVSVNFLWNRMSHWHPVLGRQVSVPGSKLLSWGINSSHLWFRDSLYESHPYHIGKQNGNFLDPSTSQYLISKVRFFSVKINIGYIGAGSCKKLNEPMSQPNQPNNFGCLPQHPFLSSNLGIISSKKSGVKQNKNHLWEKTPPID